MDPILGWLAWAVGAGVVALITRNPLYLLLVALSAWLVQAAANANLRGEGRASLQSWRGLIRIGALVWLLAVPMNALMIHQGERVLFRLPLTWPLVGGNITWEAIAFGVVSGLAIWVLLVIFSTFNGIVDASQLLRLTPPFLYQAGVVTSIALTFMPQLLASAQQIREAQRMRGHRFRGWRDLLPLFVPLLTTSLEHAIQLAESMESRGFGGQLSGLSARQNLGLRLLMVGALGLLLCGLALYTFGRQAPWVGVLLMIAAALLLAFAFRTIGRHVQRSHYRRTRWRRRDSAIVFLSLGAAAVLLVVRARDALALAYYPYPPYPLAPAFDPLIGAVVAMLAVPGVISLLDEPAPLPSATEDAP